ncbi:hypothetical protein MAR_017683 [Mya arenaria]|uniref:Uncharacterized protein n=1 Tax=Mya arenaria TaxID=6604 RepID=A0ABY7ECY5_MYAAR|nr:hypothetical protein MAR_017683 [Mya arenaria]
MNYGIDRLELYDDHDNLVSIGEPVLSCSVVDNNGRDRVRGLEVRPKDPTSLYLDGTFRTMNKPFTQFRSVHIFSQQGDSVKQVPLLFVMMAIQINTHSRNISKKTFEEILVTPILWILAYVLQKLIEVLDGAPARSRSANPFPQENSCVSTGCAFHWCLSVLRNVQHLVLKATYERREGTHQLIRKLLAFPFLPGQHIWLAFLKLKDRANASSRESVDGENPQRS